MYIFYYLSKKYVPIIFKYATCKGEAMDITEYKALRAPIKFNKKIRIISTACVGGKKESEGPLGKFLDESYDDPLLGEDSFEKAESKLCENAMAFALSKAGLRDENIDALFAGDLLNQCAGSGYGLASFDIPYLGLYGACSTCAEGLMLAALLIESGQINTAAVVASSHFCSAERQFRFPLGYGSFSGPTAQNTVTGAGAFILCNEENFDLPKDNAVYIDEALPGIVSDRGIKDAGNMGAAMCTAAADTIDRYIDGSSQGVDRIDTVATGDLGWEGTKLLSTLLGEKGSIINDKLTDCGLLIYDLKTQSVGCGGSGCGCSAVVTAGYFFESLKSGELSRVALIGTGAMMSPKSLKQGESIPAVAHLVTLKSGNCF